ncbi:hypothetical protein A6A06_04200 [Streptomyces sp. CB02923]|uniref:hypothetical protein n=1 Tax=Streptomyces sp. CB02923 TaxID=1718985 RepID=UPI000938C654|nr:hypothetical protein [Streptomyces sp. CB02923]OKI09843.1 hypothetical protein A6A06_04200 [Streptomyces sp. CB02923]
MKQGTIRTLGVAALGVAFAASAAGTASATATADTVPVDVAGTLQSLPDTATAEGATGDHGASPSLKANNKGNLLGGLPAGGLTKALPIG